MTQPSCSPARAGENALFACDTSFATVGAEEAAGSDVAPKLEGLVN
ncbi:MAG TPA: hypothetical protein VGI88_05675 [Verrucomicrobiae bacterium]